MNINKHPIVTVIIPIFNGAHYIRGAVESVLNQTFQDFEIIIVDDGSTDETFALIEPWIKDGTVRYFHQINKGAAVARNLGIRMAKGEFLKFLDSDDCIYPQQLELQVDQLNNKPEQYIAVTDFEFEFESKTRKYVKISLGKETQLVRVIIGNIGPIHGFLVRRSLVEKVGGFDEELSSCQDYDLWLRIVLQGGVFERVEYFGCLYRILGQSTSSKQDKQLRNYCKVFEKLNQTLMPKLNQLSDDVLEQIILTNTKIIHMCFIQRIKPISCLPAGLKVNQIIYVQKKDGFRNFLLRIIGIQNISLLNYLKACLTKRNYRAKLDITAWRDERNY